MVYTNIFQRCESLLLNRWKTLETKGFILIWYHHKSLFQLFPIHLNTYVMGLRPLEIFYSYSAGIDFSRQNLRTIDVRFWWLKSIPAL